MESNLCIQASRETGLHAPALSMAGTVDINPVPTTLSAHHGQESESESAKRTSVQTDGSAFSTVMSAADAFQKEMSLVDSLEAPEPTVTRHSTSHDDTKGEAFPDYYESCEMNTQLVDSAHEEAYNYAMSKVAEEVIRFREVDTGVTALPSLSTFQAHDMVADEDQGDSDEEDRETEIWGPAAGDINKLTALEGLARLLIQPDLKPSTQKRFMSITNMAVRMEYLLFSQHGPDTEMKLTERDVWELNVMASEMVRYLTSVDDKLRGLVDDAYRVVCVLSAAAKDRRTSAWLRYKRMALIVMRWLRKPRSLERQLLCAFLEFYDTHIYTMFLVIYNRRIVQEDLPPAEMLQLSRNLIAMWDVLNRGIGNYGLYVDMMVSIRDRYFVPVTKELGYCPDLWQETWDTHQDEAVESVGEREEEKREA